MKLGSLFDGSGGFPLAGSLCGIEPVWAAEVEPYPIAVTRSRFPSMRHLGDISKVDGSKLEPVDVITFGSPCQDLSVAGKQAGIKHTGSGDDETTRSGLFMEAVRIIKEMREATYGLYPRFALWENVPGAFSSNKGEDFRTVLEELIRIPLPGAVMPSVPCGGWAYADSYTGDGWSLAYRVFDAQYWGVPQRRRRIHLVLDLRGECAREVLFEREGLRGYFAEGGTPGQGVAGDAQKGTESDDRPGVECVNGTAVLFQPMSLREENWSDSNVRNALRAGESKSSHCIVDCHILDDQGGQQINVRTDGKVPTLRAETHGNLPCVLEPIPLNTLSITHGSGGDLRRGDGIGKPGEPQFTISCCHPHAVAYGFDRYNQCSTARYIVRRLTPTECARLQGFTDRWGDIDRKEKFTDAEWCFWSDVRNTHAAINGRSVKSYTKAQMLTWYNKLHTDSAEYKMWGNGIALPPALYCMQGIEAVLRNAGDDSWLL